MTAANEFYTEDEKKQERAGYKPFVLRYRAGAGAAVATRDLAALAPSSSSLTTERTLRRSSRQSS